MTPLRQRMLNDMTVRGLAENTKKSHLNSVTGLARHYRRSPDSVSAQEVQDYLIHLHEQRGLTWKSCNCARHGIRFFYRITLGLPEPHFYLPGAKTPSTLPEILNRDELLRLFTVTANPKHRTLLMTAYAAGLRCSKLTRLRVSDIDSGRMLLRVDQGKGSKDRYVPLWYRGTGVGPYPCMSALQALERICDQLVDVGIPVRSLVSILLDGCKNLAMVGLVVGLLVRHLEKADSLLDTCLTEPFIWRLEFARCVNEISPLAKIVLPNPARIASKTYGLADWLIEIRGAAADSDLIDTWQQIVDALVVAGETKLAPYSD